VNILINFYSIGSLSSHLFVDIGGIEGWVIVVNATFNNISVISWRSMLLVEETGVPGENHQPASSH